jgi:hypothetical protein
MIKKDVMHAAAIILLSFAGHAADDKDSKQEVRKATTETKKIGQANVDVGDINFDGKFGGGSNKKNKNKNKGGGNPSESK